MWTASHRDVDDLLAKYRAAHLTRAANSFSEQTAASLPGICHQRATFSPDHKSIEVSVRPRARRSFPRSASSAPTCGNRTGGSSAKDAPRLCISSTASTLRGRLQQYHGAAGDVVVRGRNFQLGFLHQG
jgi:hypothetical protein